MPSAARPDKFGTERGDKSDVDKCPQLGSICASFFLNDQRYVFEGTHYEAA